MTSNVRATISSAVEAPAAVPGRSFRLHRLRIAVIGFVALAGLIRVWIGRYSLNPDGMCYLDLGDAFFHRKWSDAVNGYWSPLYSWLLGAALSVTKPSRWLELPVVHAVNFLIYLAAIVCFEFFLRALSESTPDAAGAGTAALPKHSLLALGYALFLWTTLDLLTIWDISPDSLVAAFVFLIAGLLLQIRRKDSLRLYAILGLVLGLAYLTKAVMFPLGLAFILIGFSCVPRQRRLAFLLLTTSCFLAVSAPWLVALSQAKGRFTFGDSGKLNYSALVSPGGRLLNWQGDPPGSGTPVHTTRQVLEHPPVYEFAAPVGGTYPPSFDPSYWNEGRKWTFDVRAQLRTIEECLLLYAGLFLRDQSGLLAGATAWILLGGGATRRAILEKWPLLAMGLAPLGLYALVHAEPRFIAGYIAVFWMTILSAIRLPDSESQRRSARYLAIAIIVTILLSVGDGTVRAMMAGGPYSALDQVVASDAMEKMGLRAGDQVAVVGDGNWSFWARSAKFKIVTTVTEGDAPAFWKEPPDQRREVYRAFAHAGARAAITSQPLAADDGWQRIGNTKYYVRWLSE